MRELHNTNPLNHMQNSGIAKVLIWGGKWGPRRRLDKLGVTIGVGGYSYLSRRVSFESVEPNTVERGPS